MTYAKIQGKVQLGDQPVTFFRIYILIIKRGRYIILDNDCEDNAHNEIRARYQEFRYSYNGSPTKLNRNVYNLY